MGDNWCMTRKFRYSGFVLDESSSEWSEYSRQVASAIRPLVNTRNSRYECAKVLDVEALVFGFIYGMGIVL